MTKAFGVSQKFLSRVIGTVLLACLGACGGGGSNSSSAGATTPVAQTPVTDTQPTGFTPSAQTLASKSSASGLSFDSSIFFGIGACNRPITNRVVVVQTHTATFAADGVSEDDLIEAAEHSENAVKEIRQRFPNASSASLGLWNNKRVFVCVQNETTDGGIGVGRAASNTGTDFSGAFVVISPSRYFPLVNGARAAISQSSVPGKTFQAIYQRVFAHEMMHIAEFAKSVAPWYNGVTQSVEPWFSEGIAKHLEFGKTDFPRSAIVADLNAANPIRSNSGSQTLPANQYRAAGAIFTYLLSPLGANNSEATVSAFYAALKAEVTALNLRCHATSNPAGDCPTSTASFETWRLAMFERAFEANFKERDGTPMKLRSGANNLQDTVVTRLDQFW